MDTNDTAPPPSPRDIPEIAAVIVSWNSRDVVLGCIGALLEQHFAGGLEIIVVDNGSADGTVAAVETTYPAVRVIANPVNRGLPAANNQGIVASRAPFLLVSNSDTLVRPGALAAFVAAARRHERAAFIVPRILYDDGRLQTSAGELPSLGEALLGRQFQRFTRRTTGYWWDGWAHDTERPIGRGLEACYLVRREAVEAVGLQDEAYVLDWEGPDWTARMRDGGWEIWFCPDAEVVHLGGVSIRQVQTRWIISSHRGMYRFYSRRQPRWRRPFLATAIFARAVAKFVGSKMNVSSYEQGHQRRKGRPGGTE